MSHVKDIFAVRTCDVCEGWIMVEKIHGDDGEYIGNFCIDCRLQGEHRD